MIILGFEITDRVGLKRYGTNAGKLSKAGLHAVAERWHAKSLPSHFTPGNDSRYRYQKRTGVYRDKIKKRKGRGQGRFVDMKLTGQSERWAKTFVRISSSSRMARVRMTVPTYFTKPHVGPYRDHRGRPKRITQQPDKPAELTTVSAADRLDLFRVARRAARRELRNARAAARTTKIGG